MSDERDQIKEKLTEIARDLHTFGGATALAVVRVEYPDGRAFEARYEPPAESHARPLVRYITTIPGPAR